MRALPEGVESLGSGLRSFGVRRRRIRPLALGLLAVLGTAGCEKKEFPPPSREERVEEAASRYSPALFDTIVWESSSGRIEAGNVVFAAHCRRCHGYLGRGDTEYAREEGLTVPSLVAPDWEHGADTESVRRRVYVGHPARMPTWGVAGITPREIDAVAFYITEQLRPEVLGRGRP